MNIFTTRARKVIIFTLIIVFLFTTTGYSLNYTKKELEDKIEKIALERGVPSVFLKSIAQVESNLQHFNTDGTPKISRGGHIGLMQVGNRYNLFNTEKLKYDVDYNINAGIEVLLIKWQDSVRNKSVSSVGDMDPNVLENWYFALWAYNGWIDRNNPNINAKAYQNRIYNICEINYNQPVSRIDTSRLPVNGKPNNGFSIATPSNVNYANIYQYAVNDLVSINSIINDKCLRNAPLGYNVHKVNNGQTAQIVEGPVLVDGFYWYKIKVDDNIIGWIERNWIKKIGDIENGVYPFEDITYHWCGKSVMNLYNQKLISGKTSTEFCPDDNMTREEFCALFSKVLDIKDSKDEISENSEIINYTEELRFLDKDKISAWAIDYIKSMDKEELLNLYGENMYPSYNISRGEITYIIAKYIVNQEKEKFEAESEELMLEREFDINEAFKLNEIQLPFTDLENLSEWQINNIKIVYSFGLISGEDNDSFNYGTIITRGAVASVLNKLQQMYN